MVPLSSPSGLDYPQTLIRPCQKGLSRSSIGCSAFSYAFLPDSLSLLTSRFNRNIVLLLLIVHFNRAGDEIVSDTACRSFYIPCRNDALSNTYRYSCKSLIKSRCPNTASGLDVLVLSPSIPVHSTLNVKVYSLGYTITQTHIRG